MRTLNLSILAYVNAAELAGTTGGRLWTWPTTIRSY